MNASAASSSAPAPPEGTRDASPRIDDCERRQRGDDFDRLLRDKAAARDDDRDSDGPATQDDGDAPGMPAFVPLFAAPALQRAAAASLPGIAPATTLDANGALRGAAGGAASGDAAPQAIAASRADAAGAWQVSLSEPLGVAVELRATQPAGAGPAAGSAPWTLTIASSVQDAAVLMRHAPRLNERLRARALAHTHVRIQGDDEDAS